jgi:serine/threonine protein kinase
LKQYKKKMSFDDSNYKIVKKLGKGTFGTAYAVVRNDEDDVRNIGAWSVAKVFRKRVEDIESVRNEIFTTTLLRVTGRPAIGHIVCIHDIIYNVKKSQLVMISDYNGKTLDTYSGVRMFFGSALGPIQTMHLMIHDMTRALGSLHGIGIVHRDLKPGNIAINADKHYPTFTLLDLGLASPRGAIDNGQIVGTPLYVHIDLTVSVDSFHNDIWALAMTCITLMLSDADNYYDAVLPVTNKRSFYDVMFRNRLVFLKLHSDPLFDIFDDVELLPCFEEAFGIKRIVNALLRAEDLHDIESAFPSLSTYYNDDHYSWLPWFAPSYGDETKSETTGIDGVLKPHYSVSARLDAVDDIFGVMVNAASTQLTDAEKSLLYDECEKFVGIQKSRKKNDFEKDHTNLMMLVGILSKFCLVRRNSVGGVGDKHSSSSRCETFRPPTINVDGVGRGWYIDGEHGRLCLHDYGDKGCCREVVSISN